MAEKLGFQWMDKSDERSYDPTMVYSGTLNSAEVKFEDLKNKVLLCTKTKMPYNIQERELTILKQKKLPLPNEHWKARLNRRAEKFIFPWKLQMRKTVDTHHLLPSPIPEKYQIREKAIA